MYQLFTSAISRIRDRADHLAANPEEGAINTLEIVVIAAIVVTLIVTILWPQIQALLTGWMAQIPTSF